MPDDFTPYSTVVPLMAPSSYLPWVTDLLDKQRIASYMTYEQIYHNVPTVFKLMLKGTDNASPIYVPTAKTIIDATHRFVAPKLTFQVEGSDSDRESLGVFMTNLFTRERWRAKYASNKRFGLIRGDWLWMISANPLKAPGKRISIQPVDPASYFPIWSDTDVDQIIGCHIVDTFIDSQQQTKIKRLTYRYADNGNVTVEEGIFKTDDWGGPEAKPESITMPLSELTGITQLPVYHVRNVEEPLNPFGSSQLRGLERIMAAVNQSISDQELALALQGLGMYGTDAEPPTDDDGNEINWVLGPGRVVEHDQGAKFYRIDGVTSVQGNMDHLQFLIDQLQRATTVSDTALGKVDISIVESGVALALKFAPMLSMAEEKNEAILDLHAQMFYDLRTMWLPVYEALRTDDDCVLRPVISDAMPMDRSARVEELNGMMDRHVISTSYYRQEMAKLGYVFPTDIEKQIASDVVAADPFGERMAGE